MRRYSIVLAAALLACGPGAITEPEPTDASPPRDKGSPEDASPTFDITSGDLGVAIVDRPAPRDLPRPLDTPPVMDVPPARDIPPVATDSGVPPPTCDARFSFNPTTPGDDAAFVVGFTDTTGYVYVGMGVTGPGAPATSWIGVSGTPFTWRWNVTGHVAGRYTFRFTVDNGARTIATCARDVAARGGVRDAGARDVPATPTDTGPLTTPPDNRFGIGLVGPGNPAQLDLAANLSGPGGHVKLIFAGVRPGMTAPTAEWSNAVRDAYARDLVPVIRFGPDWGDRRVRNQSDDGSGRRYTRLAQAYAAIVRGLPLRAGWPLYVEVHNEPNLCYEWQCDAGAFAGNRITLDVMAAEYASLVRDVTASLHALGDPRVRVANGGVAPGGVRWCACVGTRDTGSGEWEGGTTSLDFLRAMNVAVPGVFNGLDAFASHAYPASGRGYGFFPPYASAGVGLRYFNDELAAIGRTLPVLVTETGWSVNRDGGGTNSRDDIAAWTRQAWLDVWLSDRNVRAVMPFQLQDSAWDAFAWVSASGSPYPVYSTVRTLRCGIVRGRCP